MIHIPTSKVIIDGADVSHHVTKVEYIHIAGSEAHLRVTFVPGEVQEGPVFVIGDGGGPGCSCHLGRDYHDNLSCPDAPGPASAPHPPNCGGPCCVGGR